MNLLQEPCEAVFHTVFHPAGMEKDLKVESMARKILPKLLVPSIEKIS
jgi:hypothetical protein